MAYAKMIKDVLTEETRTMLLGVNALALHLALNQILEPFQGKMQEMAKEHGGTVRVKLQKNL